MPCADQLVLVVRKACRERHYLPLKNGMEILKRYIIYSQVQHYPYFERRVMVSSFLMLEGERHVGGCLAAWKVEKGGLM
jgi:hypothetical protein